MGIPTNTLSSESVESLSLLFAFVCPVLFVMCWFFFFFFFCLFAISLGRSHSIWRFPGEGTSWSCSHRPTPEPQQCGIRASSATYTAAHGNAGSLTHWARPGIEPKTSWATMGTLRFFFFLLPVFVALFFSPVYYPSSVFSFFSFLLSFSSFFF